jgi:hypothetical protein
VESFVTGPEDAEKAYEKRKGVDVKEMFERLHR